MLMIALSSSASAALHDAAFPSRNESILLQKEGADPWVTADGAAVYYTQTTGSEIRIWKASSVRNIASAAPVTVWEPGQKDRALARNIWAPELHKLDGRWYIYFAADDGNNANHRMYVLESDEPMGPYRLKARLVTDGEDSWAIDGTVFEKDGQRYIAWSGWPGRVDERQNLYIAKLKNPWTIDGRRELLSEPEHGWEWTINEGPEVLQDGGRIFLIYSAHGSWTNHYKLGMLELSGPDIMKRESWTKTPRPVFRGIRGPRPIYSPGHCSFLSDPSDGSLWILYHVAKAKDAGWNREVRAQRWEWNEAGKPHFGVPRRLFDKDSSSRELVEELPVL